MERPLWKLVSLAAVLGLAFTLSTLGETNNAEELASQSLRNQKQPLGPYEYLLPSDADSILPQRHASRSTESLDWANHVYISYFAGTLWTDMQDVAVTDSFAFCGLASGIQVLDITDKTNPTLVAQLPLPQGLVTSLTLVGDRLYVADGPGGLKIVDVSNPLDPQLLGSLAEAISGYASDVQVAGNYAFLADGYGGLKSIDISNPTAPVAVGRYYVPSYAINLRLAGNLAYVASTYAGLRIINIAIPSHMTLVGSYGGTDNWMLICMGVTLRDNYAYLGCKDSLRVIDVSNPASPQQVNGCDAFPEFRDMETMDYHYEEQQWTLLYTAGEGDLGAFHIEDPLAEIHGDYHSMPGEGWIYHVTLDSTYVYAPVTYSGLYILRSTDFNLATGKYDIPGTIRDLSVQANRAYVVGEEEGVRILDIANPESPVQIGRYSFPQYSWNQVERYAFDGNKMCLVVHTPVDSLLIIDATDPTNLQLQCAAQIDYYLAAVALKGDIVYLSEYDRARLTILNISNTKGATLLGRYQSEAGNAMCFTVEDSLVYLCTNLGLEVLNVSDPANVILIGTLPGIPQTPYDITIHDNLCFIIGSGGCQVVDITDPKAPVGLVVRPILAPAINISDDGNLAFVGGVEHGMGVYQASGPILLNQAGQYDVSGYAWRAVPVGDLVYMTDQNSFTVLRFDASMCGDPNNDGSVDISDAVYLISYIFAGGPPPDPGVNTDLNCDGGVDISDVVYTIAYIFAGGPAPCASCK